MCSRLIRGCWPVPALAAGADGVCAGAWSVAAGVCPGGVFGVAVLASIFGRYGGYESGQSFVDGLTPAIYAGAAVVFVGALAALAIPRIRRTVEAPSADPVETLLSRCACSDCFGPLVDLNPEARTESAA